MQSAKVAAVARFELVSTVRQPLFWVVTLLAPAVPWILLALGGGGGPGPELPAPGRSLIVGVAPALLFLPAFAVALLFTTGRLVRAVAVEKENRVAEVLLASARAEDIVTGKLLGRGAAGLVQVLIWSTLIVLLAANLGVELASVPLAGVAIATAAFLVGYFFIGSLMIGTGALARSEVESQQLSAIWILLAMAPLLFVTSFLAGPGSAVLEVLTFVPFTAPLSIGLRALLGTPPIGWAEVVASLALLVLCTWLVTRMAAGLLRIGMVLRGSRPSVRQLARQAWSSP